MMIRPVRVKAAAIHLAISAVIIASMVALFVVSWYPMPFFVTDGGWRGIRLVAAVDIVLGPFLTFVVFSANKPRKKLVFDLAVIGLLQLFALSLGIWAVSTKRITAVVFADGFFYSMDADSLSSYSGQVHDLIGKDRRKPVYLVVDLPDDPAERQAIRKKAMGSGKPLYMHDDRIIPLDGDARSELEAFDVNIEQLIKKTEDPLGLNSEIGKLGYARDDVYVVPTISRDEKFFMLISKKDMSPVGWVRGIRF